jgi:hypothetical protein
MESEGSLPFSQFPKIIMILIILEQFLLVWDYEI